MKLLREDAPDADRRESLIVEEGRLLAGRNLELLEKRRQKGIEIRSYIKTARGQMNLIDNTVRLLRDQIVAMHSPAELSGQLDELLGGVEALQAAAREAEQLPAEPPRAASAQRVTTSER
jgi:hypothetical protein